MKKFAVLGLSIAVVLSLAMAPSAQAKVKVTKPAAPTVAAISSSPVKKGKVNVTIAITLPTNTGGAKITGSKVTAGGKSCTIKNTKTSCTIKGLKNGKTLGVRSQSKNKKGYGAKSAAVSYRAGAAAYPAPVIASAPAASSAPEALTAITTAAITGLTVPLPGNTPDTTVDAGTGYTASITWSPSPTTFVSNTPYTATITLTASSGYTLTGVAADFFTVAGSSSDTNAVDSGVVTAVFPGVVYSIADTGPAGGWIFITPTTSGNTTGKYFEAAAADLSSTKAWCNVTTTVGVTGLTIGDGKTNTNLIAAACETGAGQDAVDYSVTTNSITYADWFLPSQNELNELCLFAKVTRPGTSTCDSSALKPGFVSDIYWSSSEILSVYAYGQVLTSGEQEFSSKGYLGNIRVVRTFE